MAIAARTADYLTAQGSSIFESDRRDMRAPKFRRDLSPPDTWGHGMPAL
jgi:hypothetical protein